MNLLSSLGTLVTYLKNITMPGLLAAAAVALLLWPPRPFDRVPVVIDNHVDIASLQLTPRELQDDTPLGFSRYLLKSTPACTIREGAASDGVLARPVALDNRATVALSNQLVLDDLHRDILKCVEEEQALQGMEEGIITNLTALIAARNGERDAINAMYHKYLASLSPLADTFHQRLESKEADVAGLQAHLLSFQRVQKERARRVSELNRLDGELKERISDNGRLRPAANFDTFLTGLGNHAVGFLVLVLAWGLLLDPINRAIFSWTYDRYFDTPWDAVRPERTQWQHALPSLRARGSTQGGWRSRTTPSTLAFTLCMAAAAAVVLVSELTGERPGRLTATVLCADWRDRILTYEATVTVPGGKEVPKGQLEFLETESDTTLATRDLRNGKATYVTGPSANRTLVAKYRGSRGFASSASEPLSSDGLANARSGLRCTPFLPDLTSVATPDWRRALVTCLLVSCSALFAASCTPGILRSRREGDDTGLPRRPENTPAENTCEEKLNMEWPRLSQPEYAIGQGVILRTDYEALQNSYYSQSLISVGSILPVAFLVFALVLSPDVGLSAVGLYTLLWGVVGLLVITGVDRRHKYEAELETLIASAFLKRCTAKEGDKKADGTDLSKRIAEVLRQATVVSHTNLHISVPDSGPTHADLQAPKQG